MRGLQRGAAYEAFDIRLARIIFDCVIAQSLSKMEMHGQAALTTPNLHPSHKKVISPPNVYIDSPTVHVIREPAVVSIRRDPFPLKVKNNPFYQFKIGEPMKHF